MAFDERDPSDLKLHVLVLLLEHPQGISFGDFSAAFRQLHGHHPHISLYGYSSLRQLIADMKDLVVVEGSGTPVMKFIKGLTLDNWPEVENGLQCSAEEPRCLMNGEKAEQQSGLADVLVALTNLLAEYKSGLRIKKLQEFLLARDGIDLEKFSISHRYKDTLEFLEAQMPELSILYQENRVKCVVQLMADSSASSASATIQNSVEEPVSHAPALSDILAAVLKLLAKYKWGLKIKKLQDLLLAEDGVDLEKFSISHGNKDTLEFLEVQMPELHIQYKENHLSCVVMLPTEGLPDILAAVSNLLAKYKLGLKIKTLQELLLARDGIDLKKISITHGYKDTLEFLEAQMPELHIQYKANLLSCLVQLRTEDLSDTLAAITNILAKYKLGLKIKKLQDLLLAEEGVDLEKFSISHGNKDTLQFLEDQMPELNIQYKENHLSCVVQLPADICVSSASSNVQNNGKEPAGQPPVPCIPVPSLKSDSSACISNPAPSGQERLKTGTSSPAPCPGTDFPTCNSDAVSQKLTETKSGVPASSAPKDIQKYVELPRRQAPELSVPFFLIRDILQGRPHGLKLKKLKKALNENYKFDLETFRSDLGYKDATSCLQDISGLLVRNVTKCKNCVVQLESRACSPAPSLDSDFSTCCSDTTMSGLTRPEFGASTLAPQPDFCAFNADAVPQKPLATSSGLAEVLVALTNLLAAYKSGLRVTKLQEFLLARDGIDLMKFSISHGYKDTLEFLEAQMTELSIHYREDRLSSVIQLAAGCGDNAKPLSTSCHSSASKAQDQSLPVSASPTVENGVHKYPSVVQPPVLPSFDNPCITSHAKISNSHQHLCPGPAQPPKACQLNGPLPPDEVSPQVDVEVPKISSSIKDQPAKDLEELKRQVAHILARHPEGMSLFQFRAAYSATYQQHLPLGNASSAKQCLLKMPDVVQLKGSGVQTLLLPVSLAAPPAQSGQPASSTVEKTPTVPGHTLPPTTAVAEPQLALRPILSKAPEVPQQYPSFLPPDRCREPSDQESCLLPRGQPPTATNPWQEHQRARAKAEDISGQPGWSRVEKATVDLAISVPKASLVGALESRLKPPAPNTAVMPTPQTPLSFLQASELCRQKNSKECSLFSQPVPQKAPLPVYPVQEYVRTNPKPACTSFPPQSPVVFPTTPTSWDKNLKPSNLEPKSTHLANPWSQRNCAPATLASQPVSAGFQAWSQPVVHPPIAFLSEMPAHPITYPTPFVPTPCQIQVPKYTLQSHPHAQKVTPKRPAQVMPPIHSTAQWSYILAVPHSNTSQVPETSKTLPPSAVVFPAGWSPLSPPPRNTDASRSPKSQAVPQLACSNQDGLQGFSLPGANEKHLDTTLEGVTSKPPSPTYPRPYNNADPLETSSSTLPISSLSLSSTKASLEPPYASSGIKKNSNSPLEPPAFLNQQQFTSGSTAPGTSDVRPAGSPPSLLDPTGSPDDQPLHPLSSITSNSDVHFSEPESFNDPQTYTSVSAVGTVSSTPSLSSPLCPVGSPSSPPRQPSSAGWKGGIDYGAPDQKKAMPTIFNQTGSPPGPLSRRQTLPNPSPPVSPPSQSFDKCVIL